MTRLVRALWAGEVPLARAFWEYTILYCVMLNGATTVGSFALFSADKVALGLLVHLLPLPYNLLMLIAVWRSAGRYAGPPVWAAAARVVVAIFIPLAIVA